MLSWLKRKMNNDEVHENEEAAVESTLPVEDKNLEEYFFTDEQIEIASRIHDIWEGYKYITTEITPELFSRREHKMLASKVEHRYRGERAIQLFSVGNSREGIDLSINLYVMIVAVKSGAVTKNSISFGDNNSEVAPDSLYEVYSILRLIMNEYLFSLNYEIENLLIAINSKLGEKKDLQGKLEKVMFIPVKDIAPKLYIKKLTDGEENTMGELLDFIHLSSEEMDVKASERYKNNSLFKKIERGEITRHLSVREPQSHWGDPE